MQTRVRELLPPLLPIYRYAIVFPLFRLGKLEIECDDVSPLLVIQFALRVSRHQLGPGLR